MTRLSIDLAITLLQSLLAAELVQLWHELAQDVPGEVLVAVVQLLNVRCPAVGFEIRDVSRWILKSQKMHDIVGFLGPSKLRE